MKDIPTFSLYGETTPATDTEFVHIEDIQSRSAQHNWEIDAHTHRGLFQIVAVEAGGATVLLDGRRIEAAPPAVVAVPPAAVHAFRFQRGTRGYVLTVAEALLFDEAGAAVAGALESLFVEPRVVAFAADAMRPLLALLHQIADEFRQESLGRAALVEWLVRAALLHVARAHLAAAQSDQGARGRGRAERFAGLRKLVEDHYREHWPLSRYAASLKITESQLNRLTRSVAGVSAAELIQQRLLLEARRRLIHVAAPVAQIAYELGYQDPAYFCRIFKKRVGLTPSAFRQQRSLS
jgi:AraC family transcriptional activator of pobA